MSYLFRATTSVVIIAATVANVSLNIMKKHDIVVNVSVKDDRFCKEYNDNVCPDCHDEEVFGWLARNVESLHVIVKTAE